MYHLGRRWRSLPQRGEASRCPFLFWGCLLVLEEDESWLRDKTTKHLLNNLLQVTKAAMIREKRNFLKAKCRSPGNTDFSLLTSPFDLLSQTNQSSKRTHFISPQRGNLPPCNIYLKWLCRKNVMTASAALTCFYNGIIADKGKVFLILCHF